MKTTLNEIRKYSLCADGWETLLKYLGKTKADYEEISILTILDSNGLEDAIWCLRAVEGHAKEIRLYAVWCVRQVEHLLNDQRSLDALDVAERYANGDATEAELTAAADAAWYAEAAAWSGARDAAWAAWYAAEAAAWSAWYAARAARAAWYAEAAALTAAAAAAWAAWYAARAARAATRSAAGAYATEAAAWTKQEAELRRICGEGVRDE